MADNQVILEFLADTAGLQAAAKQMLALGTISKEQFAAFNKANQESEQRIRSVTKAQSDLDKAVVQTTKDGKAMNDSFRQLTATIAGEVLKEAVAGIAEMGAEMHETTNKSVSLRTQLKAMKDEMATLDEGSERFQELAINAGKLTDEIGDINARIKFLASDTKWTDAFVATVNLATGSIAALQGGMALFGEESEDVQKALLKVNGAMALAQGTQQVFNALQKESAFMMGLAEAKTIAYGTALRVVDGISKTTGLSMAASWALATGGLTVLLGSVIALVSYLRDAEDATAAFADNKAQEQLASAKQQEELQASIYQRIKEQDAAFREDLDRQRKDYEIKGMDAQVTQFNMLTQIIEKYNSRLLSYAKGEQAIELTEQRETEINDIIRDATLARNAILKDADEKRKRAATEAFEKRKRAELAKKVDNLDSYFLKDKEVDLEVKGLKIKAEEVKIEKVPEIEFKPTITPDAWAEFMGGLEKAQPYIQAFAEASSLIFDAVREESKRTMDEQITALNKARDKELENKKLTDDQKAAINEKYRRQENKIKVENFEKDKQMRLAEASINGLVALTSLMKETPPPNPLFFVGAALIGLQTGLAIGMIAKEKAPAYEKGGKNIPGGMKLVGEKGPELIYTPGGETVIPHGDTAKILEAWSIPMPKVPEGVKGDMAIGMAIPPMDYDRIGSAVAGALAKNPSLNVRIDGEGFGMHIVQKGRIVHLLNNDYRA